MKKNILFVFAHFDDESFSAGTIKKLVDKGHSVNVLIICGNGKEFDDNRKNIFHTNITLLGCEGSYLKYFDLTLGDLKEDVKIEIKDALSLIIMSENISEVYTNCLNDLHSDHRVVSEMVRVVCRPNTKKVITKLYECYIPGSLEFGILWDDFKTIVDISDYANLKSQCILNYSNYLKSMDYHKISMLNSQYNGALYGFDYAERFKLIWEKQ